MTGGADWQACPRCRSSAYVGVAVVECAVPMCRNHHRLWHCDDRALILSMDQLLASWLATDDTKKRCALEGMARQALEEAGR